MSIQIGDNDNILHFQDFFLLVINITMCQKGNRKKIYFDRNWKANGHCPYIAQYFVHVQNVINDTFLRHIL